MNTKDLIALAVTAGLKAKVKAGRVTLTGPGLAAPMSFAGEPSNGVVFAVRNIKAHKERNSK